MAIDVQMQNNHDLRTQNPPQRHRPHPVRTRIQQALRSLRRRITTDGAQGFHDGAEFIKAIHNNTIK